MPDDTPLEGRTAIVTGAGSGMGRVMSRALAAAGAQVAAVDIDAGRLDRLGEEPVFGGRLIKLTTDVSQAAACRDAVQAVAETGGPDILINCAGISMFTAGSPTDSRVKFYEARPEGWQRIIAINAIGSFLMARYAAPLMIARKWGRIVNVTTSFDTMMAGGLSAYGASKAALEATSASWAKDLAGTGVSVNILVPGGPTETDGFFPPGRPRPPILLNADVMGPPVVWLASPASDGISGSRFIARDWDTRLPPAEAAARVRAPIGWPSLAEGATAARGHAM